MTIVASTETKPSKSNGNGQGNGTGEAKPKTKTIAITVSEELHQAVTAMAESLEYTINSVGVSLLRMWTNKKVEIPVPPEKIRKDLTAELEKALTTDLAQADKIRRFLADLHKPNQGAK